MASIINIYPKVRVTICLLLPGHVRILGGTIMSDVSEFFYPFITVAALGYCYHLTDYDFEASFVFLHKRNTFLVLFNDVVKYYDGSSAKKKKHKNKNYVLL